MKTRPSRPTTDHGPISGPVNLLMAAVAVAAMGRILDRAGLPAQTWLGVISCVGSVGILLVGVAKGGPLSRWIQIIFGWGVLTAWPMLVIGPGWSVAAAVSLFALCTAFGFLFAADPPVDALASPSRRGDFVVHVVQDGEGWRMEVSYIHPSKGPRKLAAPPDATADDLVALIEKDRRGK